MRGDDYLEGGVGQDILNGGDGDDTLVGGKGNDIYLFGAGHGHDTIVDTHEADGFKQGVIRYLDGTQTLIAMGHLSSLATLESGRCNTESLTYRYRSPAFLALVWWGILGGRW